MALPIILQGGMGVNVSGWRLARAVAMAGQLGIVSGTGLTAVLARRLQDGDPDGSIRRAMSHFPVGGIVDPILNKYFVPGGRPTDQPYRAVPMFTAKPSLAVQQLAVVANFVETFLAKERHDGLVGINFLEKVALPNLASLYGAMLAGVDYVCMGAGIPRAIPGALDRLSRHETATLPLHVAGADKEDDFRIVFDPKRVIGACLPDLKRPNFLAIVSSDTLAASLAKKATGRVDGFVFESHIAGGHNAPPRGPLRLHADGQPVYGPRDAPDLARVRKLKLPFWLAGAFDAPGGLKAAMDEGAAGIQVGTPFAFCAESGLCEEIKRAVVAAAFRGDAKVVSDPRASPTGFPFRVVRSADSLSDPDVYAARKRLCDLGHLRQPYKRPDGTLGYRCPAEPILDYLRKGGRIEDTVGRKCLCNALMANVGLGQVREAGHVERLLLTAGDCLRSFARFRSRPGPRYTATEVIEYILQTAGITPSREVTG